MLLSRLSMPKLHFSGITKFLNPLRTIHNFLDIHSEVKNAINRRMPVVALESTIITHGMPYPQNLETALEVEDVVRSVGATPATIACVDGRLKVGLTKDILGQLAQMGRTEVFKCSRRDLPYIVANRKCGGTTVAATMIIAHKAGIPIFATGGVGGVHRDGHNTMDISADLIELGRTPVVVVSSGVKSILDIPRTLEYLETQGVTVASYENEYRFPDFYTPDSGFKVPYNINGPKQAAKLIKALEDLDLQSGMLIGVPIPKSYAADKEAIKVAIDQAYEEALSKGIEGKNVTPFMLSAIATITKGNSLKANIALIKNNAKIAAKIACELYGYQKEKLEYGLSYTRNKPVIIGASILDLCLTMTDDNPHITLDGATYQTRAAKESAGGVGRNLAESILKLHGDAHFISVVGNDHTGKSLLQLMPESLSSGIHVDNEKTTSICSILFDKAGNCKICLANMEIHKSISPELISQHEEEIRESPLVVMDGNLSLDAMDATLKISSKYNIPVFFEPTDMLIAGKPFQLSEQIFHPIRLISPNIFELKAIVESITGQKILWEPGKSMESGQEQLISECKALLKHIENRFDVIVVTLGSNGVLVSVRGKSFNDVFFDSQTHSYLPPSSEQISRRFYKAPMVSSIINVSGAGDSFSGGFISGLLSGSNLEDSVAFGFVAASRALQADSAVPEQYFQNNEEKGILIKKQINCLFSVEV